MIKIKSDLSFNEKILKDLIIFCCMDCGNRIGIINALYGGQGRCKSCSHKGNLNGCYGIKFFNIENPNYKDGRTLKTYFCICSNPISMHTAIYRNGLCRSCASKGEKNGFFGKTHTITTIEILQNNGKKYQGKNNPNWKGGISKLPYSIEFNEELKLKIRTRDNFECQCCGITEKEHKKKFKRVLTIHHIDYNKQNCDESNLITVCNICNTKANGNRDYWYAYYKYIMENLIGVKEDD